MSKTKVLIIEDDRPLAEVLAYNLTAAAYEVIVARDGQDGLTQARTKLPDVIILDLMLPVLDGLEVCRRLRASDLTEAVPIVMLTAKSEESDELVGFAMGADDYVTKPFSVKVLLERIKAVRRRRLPRPDGGESVTRQGITISRQRHQVTAGGRVIALTLTEFRLLDTLIRQPGRVFDRAELVESALRGDALVEERTIDVHVRGLRRKLGQHAELVETVRGVGYRFRAAQAADEPLS
jgi:two-component system phosphate regulon response regulator PhoB